MHSDYGLFANNSYINVLQPNLSFNRDKAPYNIMENMPNITNVEIVEILIKYCNYQHVIIDILSLVIFYSSTYSFKKGISTKDVEAKE